MLTTFVTLINFIVHPTTVLYDLDKYSKYSVN